jgi:sec-independent protein translocase protein TatC
MLNKRSNNSIIPYAINFQQSEAEMSLSEHLEEVRQRGFWSLSLLVVMVSTCLFSIKTIVKILQEPATGIKFLQFAPGEYFFA